MPCDSESFVDLKAIVDIRVVDQTFPSHSRPWLFEVRPHDDEKVVVVFSLKLEKSFRIVKGGGWVMDGAWADYDKETALRVFIFHD